MKLLAQLQENDTQLRMKKAQVWEWLQKHVQEIKNNNPDSPCTINDNLVVDVGGHVTIKDFEATHLPVQFGHVKGAFVIDVCQQLNTLVGSPRACQAYRIGPSWRNDTPLRPTLTNLIGPTLTNLIGSPQTVTTSYTVYSKEPFSLEGAPTKVGGSVYLNAPLATLHNIHKHFKEIGYMLDCSSTKLESHVLGVVMIKGLRVFKGELPDSIGRANTTFRLNAIINKHLEDRDILVCQDELIDAGLASFGQV